MAQIMVCIYYTFRFSNMHIQDKSLDTS